nr:unnamed protein product [Spirometra erinaceieuropaei]
MDRKGTDICCTFYVCDTATRRRFLVDNGAQISVVPPTAADRRFPSPGLHLQAANCSPISTFGSLSLTLNIGLRRSFTWIFVIADVPHAILGLDFLTEFDLVVDRRRARLLDRTTGPPVFARPRRLAPERFQAAKTEFEHMLQLGIIRPSESPWSSPLHMIPKATSDDWRPFGDYRALNSATIPDRYSVPHLQDFAEVFFGKAVFSKIDLVRAFHQIPVAHEDFLKTAVTAPFGLFEFIRMPFGLRRDFTVFTYHKPLTFALRSHSDKYSPREIAHLNYVSQFTTDIRHIDETKNEVANMLSRPSLSSLQLTHGIDLCAMALSNSKSIDESKTQESGRTPGLALLGIRAAVKSDLGCSAAELVFGTTLRLPGEMITPTPREADETPYNLVHRLRQFMRSLSPVPPLAPMIESNVEKDLDKCNHLFVRCDRVRQPLESPYGGPFPVLALKAKTYRILCGDKEDVASVDRVKAAVAEEPPDLPQGQRCSDPLTPVHPSSLSPAHSPCPLPRPSPALPSTPPRPAYFLSLHVDSIQLQHHPPA